RPRRFQKIEIALERRNRQRHATNARAEASRPDVGGIDEPVGLDCSPVRNQRVYTITLGYSLKHLCMLLHLHTQFFCPPETLAIDHMWQEKAVGRTPRCAR